MPTSPNTPNFINGVTSKFGIDTGGTIQLVNIEEGGLTIDTDMDTITHTGAGGDQVLSPGVRKAEGDLTLVFDTANKNYIAPQLMLPGSKATCHFFPDGNIDFPIPGYFSSYGMKIGPKAKAVRVTGKFMSSGAFTLPTS